MSDRFAVFMIYIWLAFRSVFYIEEAKEMYNDYARGRFARKKQEKIDRKFNLDKSD